MELLLLGVQVNTGAIIGAVAAGVLLVASIVLGIVTKKKKK